MFFASILVFTLAAGASAQGLALDGAGPINRAMGGAATAAPIDSIGAVLWNPASISGLAYSEVAFGLELLLPTENIASTISQGAFGPGLPSVNLGGSTSGEPGVAPIPSMAWVHKCDCSRWSYGIGMFGIAGYTANYPADLSNPILVPQSNQPGAIGGFGHVFADVQFYQIVPTVSYQLTDKLSVGFSPTIMLARLSADPLSFAAPDDGDGSGAARYPAGCATRYSWGGGFHVGLYYAANDRWQYGLSFKSTQWIEPFRYNTCTEAGLPRLEKVNVDYPMIISLGTAYTGFERWLLALDVRYFDYGNTAGFGDPAGYDAAGAVTGLGWNNIVSAHFGAQYRATERLLLRFGYEFNENPIDTDVVFFNAASPLICQHIASTGLTFFPTERLSLSLAYLHGFENSATGPMNLPGIGAVAGTSVTSRVSADALAFGANMRY
ncbi:MAG: outer membrane protein transport protein [Pirellulales bacterium]|nr:outer membrane protein transport protein [Pirellulales bacterium]